MKHPFSRSSNHKLRVLFLVCLASFLYSCSSQKSEENYLSKPLPGAEPVLFAPNIVNTEGIEINAVFNTSFSELFFTRIVDGSFVIHHSELIEGVWSDPQPLQLFSNDSATSVAIDPSVTLDGKTMYFLGIAPKDRVEGYLPDIYKSEKIDGEWQPAVKVGYPISTNEYAESYPVVVADGSIYFESDRPGSFGKRDVYRAQYLEDGTFDIPVNIGSVINSEETARSTYVSPDERILIKANNSFEKKGFDVSFKKDGTWQELAFIDFESPLDNDWIYCCPYMSPDGKYFFFSRRYKGKPGKGWDGITEGEVYWVDAEVVMKLKAN